MKLFYASLIAFCLVTIASVAQNDWCGTDHYYNEYIKANPQLKSKIEKEQDWLFSQARNSGPNKSGNLITVPVVVHIFHDNGIANISDAQVLDGIRVMNEDFQRTNADTSATRSVFKPYAADVGIQFKLARIDPNGKCTNGIVRINTPQTYEARDNIKSLSRWPSSKYLNIWLVSSIENFSGSGNITLGYAQFPFWGINNTYGIVARSDYWGAVGSSNSDGRTATHEAGHCFGLFHTFQDGCGSNCSFSGDEICDTPPVATNTFNCITSQNSCSNDASGSGSPYSTNVVDQIENYMSYDDCQNMFTLDQKDVMVSVFSSISELANLVSQANLVATGTDSDYVSQACAPVAEFLYPAETICETNSVKYIDISYNGVATNRTWNFPGGTPSTSSDSVVTVVYNTSGIYNASLTVTNAKGSDSKTHTSVVDVRPVEATLSSWIYEEGLEDTTFATYWSVVNNSGSNKWQVTSNGAYSGSNSLYLNNYSGNPAGSIDEFISPGFDFSAVNNPELFFKVAYRRRFSLNNDVLKVHYSIDCGRSWVTRFVQSGDKLETAPVQNALFVPADATEWKEVNVKVFSSATKSKNVIFRFEFIGDGGNNIYIDDIFIKNPTGIAVIEGSAAKMSLYPNPANGNSTLTLEVNEKLENASVFISDLSGREVVKVADQRTFTTGQHQIELPVATLSEGMYFVNFVTEKGRQIEKLIVN